MPQKKLIIKFKGYLFAILISAVVYFVKAQLIRSIQWPEKSFMLNLMVVIVAGWYGGIGPGILATLINYFINDYFFITPGELFFRNTVAEKIIIMLFFVEGFMVSFLFEMVHRARRKAQILDEKKSEFLSIVAHELRTPLSIIKIISETLLKRSKKDTLPYKVTTGLTDISGEIDKTENMVRDLLDISRIENNSFVLHLSRVNINKLIRNVVEKMQKINGNRRIDFDVDRQEARFLNLDKERIEQVLINMINNALQHSSGNSSVKLSLKTSSDEITIVVYDKGVGIPKDLQSKVFEKYYQIENNESKGFGLGLYISKEIILKHQGKIWLDSTPGKGSKFYVSLPLN